MTTMESRYQFGTQHNKISRDIIFGRDEHITLPSLTNKYLFEEGQLSSSYTSSSSSSNGEFILLGGVNPITTQGSNKLGQHLELPSRYDSSVNHSLWNNDEAYSTFKSLHFDQMEMEGTYLSSMTIFDPNTTDNCTSFRAEKQSLPLQVMSKLDGYDPHRIPSSIFSTMKSSTPMEWSAASNESLFSIHLGNSSFSRDRISLLEKQGELNFSNASSTEIDANDSDTGVKEQVIDPSNIDDMNVPSDSTAEENVKEELPSESRCLSTCNSHQSSGSRASINSFAFPILTEERIISMKMETMQKPQEGTNVSMKVETIQKPQQSKIPFSPQPQQSKIPFSPQPQPSPKEGKRWFSCLYCCPKLS